MLDQKNIRNFSIIAHIDHGKSTLADRILQISGVLDLRNAKEQYLDRMELEREKGITIKSQAVKIPWSFKGCDYILNMIDTPGHVDFSYEVSRSLQACEGAVLLIDATQGVQAQTLANLYMALDAGLDIIPVINKIDLPSSNIASATEEIISLLGCKEEDIILASAKTGQGIDLLLNNIVLKIKAPSGKLNKPPRALIFDSVYDKYRGVITYIRMVDGELKAEGQIAMMSTGAKHEILELGVISPEPVKTNSLSAGEVGYIITGVKDVRLSKVGDTVTSASTPANNALEGFLDPKPFVFAGVYPIDAGDFDDLRNALEKLKLSDASLTYTPETSAALGFGFRIGFLGLLHLEIILERLKREFELNLISTYASVNYEITLQNNETLIISNPCDMPNDKLLSIKEPYIKATIIAPKDYIGAIMNLCQNRRGDMQSMNYLTQSRVELIYIMPLAEIVFNFFDNLKSITQGYASLDYEFYKMQESDLVKVDILLAGDRVDAFSAIVHKDKAYSYGLKLVEKLKDLIPRQQFQIPVQAAIGSKIIARENIKALKKDVLAKCYGGDITRKRKLLEKQKEGKKKMKQIGSVEVPSDAFISVLKTDA